MLTGVLVPCSLLTCTHQTQCIYISSFSSVIHGNYLMIWFPQKQCTSKVFQSFQSSVTMINNFCAIYLCKKGNEGEMCIIFLGVVIVQPLWYRVVSLHLFDTIVIHDMSWESPVIKTIPISWHITEIWSHFSSLFLGALTFLKYLLVFIRLPWVLLVLCET